MSRTWTAAGAVLAMVACCALAQEVAKEGAAEIEGVLKLHLERSTARDVAGVVATLHSQSPDAAEAAEALTALFAVCELKYELTAFRLLAVDGDCAVARVGQKTTKIKGPDAIRDNTVDSICVFRRDAGKWKIWQQVSIESKDTGPAAPARNPADK